MTEIDRIAPTRRPDETPSGEQKWRELFFLHWTFEPEAVRALVPEALELDLWEGRAYVGVVPFRMVDIRPSWLPRPLAMDFLETNLRTYVHHRGAPGVYFFSLEASSWLAVKAARWTWSLPYFHASMSARRCGDRVAYRSQRKRAPAAKVDVTYDVGAPLGPSEVGSLQHFLLERYHLFALRRGAVRRGQVHHPPYPARAASIVSLDEGLLAAAGLPGDGRLETVHYSDGVEVEVFGPFRDR